MEEEEKLPNKCPICDKEAKNLLLHMKSKKSCNSKIDPKLYEHWKQVKNRQSKRKYQYMYVKQGKHKKAQAKYEDKFKSHCKVCPMKVRKPYSDAEWKSHRILKHLPQSVYNKGSSEYQSKSECKCPPVDRKSYQQTKRLNTAKSRNRDRIRWGIEKGKRRLEKFKTLCLECLKCLKREDIKFADFNRFHLVEGETVLVYVTDEGEEIYDIEDEDSDDIHSWLSEIDGKLLCMVIDFQKVVLASKSKWMKAIEEVNNSDDKRHLRAQLFRLIGKLQSFGNENTKDICIPDEFKISKAPNDPDWVRPDTLNKEDELLIIDLLEDIVGEEYLDQELQEVLGALEKNLDSALLYTK